MPTVFVAGCPAEEAAGLLGGGVVAHPYKQM